MRNVSIYKTTEGSYGICPTGKEPENSDVIHPTTIEEERYCAILECTAVQVQDILKNMVRF